MKIRPRVLAVLPTDYVLKRMRPPSGIVRIEHPLGEEIQVWVKSYRVSTFKHQPLTCVRCGAQATHFELQFFPEQTQAKYAYGLLPFSDNHEMLTVDHVVPRSMGGPSHSGNSQILCTSCNKRKDNDLSDVTPEFVRAMLLKLRAEHRIGVWEGLKPCVKDILGVNSLDLFLGNEFLGEVLHG
jgi:hypothetical protein